MSSTDHNLKFAYVGLGEMGSAMVSKIILGVCSKYVPYGTFGLSLLIHAMATPIGTKPGKLADRAATSYTFNRMESYKF
jgi:hypothetical protein